LRGLLHREGDVGPSDDVDPVAHLDLIEHLRIDDPSALFTWVRPEKSHRRRTLADVGELP